MKISVQSALWGYFACTSRQTDIVGLSRRQGQIIWDTFYVEMPFEESAPKTPRCGSKDIEHNLMQAPGGVCNIFLTAVSDSIFE